MRPMKKILTAGLAVTALVGSLAVAPEASAQHRGAYHGGRYYHRGGSGAAIAAGVAGLALGAALAGNSGYYYGPSYYYGPGYYGGPYYHRCAYWRYDRWGRAYRVWGWC